MSSSACSAAARLVWKAHHLLLKVQLSWMNCKLTTVPISLSGQLGPTPKAHWSPSATSKSRTTLQAKRGSNHYKMLWSFVLGHITPLAHSAIPWLSRSKLFPVPSFPYSLLTWPQVAHQPSFCVSVLMKIKVLKCSSQDKHSNNPIQLSLLQSPPQLSPPLSPIVEFSQAVGHHVFWIQTVLLTFIIILISYYRNNLLTHCRCLQRKGSRVTQYFYVMDTGDCWK